jgi:hypothetical protein
MKVLAIEATGRFAGLVVPARASKGLQVQTPAHDPAKPDPVRERSVGEMHCSR